MIQSRAQLNVLADTWWYGMSRRWNREQFGELAGLRRKQGFDAVQIVVGIPPEVGPLHRDAASEAGAAWDLSGEPNAAYLSFARDRLSLLLTAGLRPIVYGGWGPHADWIRVEGMKRWWGELARSLRGLDVIYCLCGEIDLHCEVPHALLPDRSTADLRPPNVVDRALRRVTHAAFPQLRPDARRAHRIEAWREVLRHARAQVGQSLLVHTTGTTTAFELFGDDPDLLANTTQTGHDWNARHLLYERPTQHLRRFPNRPFMNLEPWYEGIHGSFGTSEQLFAFWASKLAGSTGHVYGAQGIWNIGDGQFLGHWGGQTLAQAIRLEAPAMLGKLHRWFRAHRIDALSPFIRRGTDGRVRSVGRRDEKRSVELLLEPDHEVDESAIRLDLDGNLARTSNAPLRLRGTPAPPQPGPLPG
jgi:hypothetical protein